MRLPPRIFLALSLAATGAAADEIDATLLTRPTLMGTSDGPKAALEKMGVSTDAWVTQFYQGLMTGDGNPTPRYGGKFDGFLKLDSGKLGLWDGFRVNAQYEHAFGESINRRDYALLPVNTALAFLGPRTYHSALSLSFSQQLSPELSVSIGKFNMMTAAAQTPLVGGGGIDTFMNRAFALPSTGVGVASRGAVADRLIVSPPYLLGGMANYKSGPFKLMLMLVDPRSAQNPRVIQRPFERGVATGASLTVETELFGLRGWHTVRAGYSNARGFDLSDIPEARAFLARGGRIEPLTKKGFRFASYSVQQNLVQNDSNPDQAWGLFGLVTLSDGNPNPIRYSFSAGLAGANLLEGRELDRWGIGFFHYGVSSALIESLAVEGIYRRSEGGIETFYNWAITPWLRLSADLQIIEPWNATKTRASYGALRLQTKF